MMQQPTQNQNVKENPRFFIVDNAGIPMIQIEIPYGDTDIVTYIPLMELSRLIWRYFSHGTATNTEQTEQKSKH
jgi:hypothetical protein